VGDLVGWLDRLAALPEPVLYLVLAVAAAAENIFPPLPADTVVAIGAFVAARGAGSLVGVLVATMMGNLGGAAGMFAVGRRFGPQWIASRASRFGGAAAIERVQRAVGRFGLAAVVVTRFIPGIRAVVPPLAGALTLPAGRTLLAMTLASAVWYGIITSLAFSAGNELERFLDLVQRSQRISGIGAATIVLIVLGSWWWRRRRTT
jgi:membrane protein DedA with SNARE-associated domain